MPAKSYFTIEEFIRSDTAVQKKIDNTPDFETVKRLFELIEFLNPLREAWGSGIRITSGYRCEQLNRTVKGKPTSAHLIGYAADLLPVNGEFIRFTEFLKSYLKDKNFDQCIVEGKLFGVHWVHFGLYNQKGEQRKQIFSLDI